MAKKLFVTNISCEAVEKHVFDLFCGYGKVTSVKIVRHRETDCRCTFGNRCVPGESRGFGFVEMATIDDADAALAADGKLFMSRAIKVVHAMEKVR